MLLRKLFPKEHLIEEFAILKTKFKRDQTSYREEYQLICAKIQVKLNVLEIDLDKEMTSQKNGNEQDDLKMKLQYTRCLKKCL